MQTCLTAPGECLTCPPQQRVEKDNNNKDHRMLIIPGEPPVRSEVKPSSVSSLARLFNYCVNGLSRWPRWNPSLWSSEGAATLSWIKLFFFHRLFSERLPPRAAAVTEDFPLLFVLCRNCLQKQTGRLSLVSGQEEPINQWVWWGCGFGRQRVVNIGLSVLQSLVDD